MSPGQQSIKYGNDAILCLQSDNISVPPHSMYEVNNIYIYMYSDEHNFRIC